METMLLSGHAPSEIVVTKDTDAASLIRLRRVVNDAAVTSGHAQGIELTSFQWGVGHGITSSPAGTATAPASDAHWIDLTSFQWGVGRGIAEANLMDAHFTAPTSGTGLAAMPTESLSLNFTKVEI
jgi:hypothetical protein